MDRGDRVALVVSGAAVVAAVATELSKPAAERTWHGRVLGFMPYDLRVPTLARLKAAYWDPDGSLLVGHPVGVGWTLNVGALVARLRRSPA